MQNYCDLSVKSSEIFQIQLLDFMSILEISSWTLRRALATAIGVDTLATGASNVWLQHEQRNRKKRVAISGNAPREAGAKARCARSERVAEGGGSRARRGTQDRMGPRLSKPRRQDGLPPNAEEGTPSKVFFCSDSPRNSRTDSVTPFMSHS